MIKLVDVRKDTEEDVEFGTCDFCSYISDHTYETMIFEDDKTKERVEIECGEWNWGHYYTEYHIEDIIGFALFLDTKNIQTFEELNNNLHAFYDEYEEL